MINWHAFIYTEIKVKPKMALLLIYFGKLCHFKGGTPLPNGTILVSPLAPFPIFCQPNGSMPLAIELLPMVELFRTFFGRDSSTFESDTEFTDHEAAG